MTGPWTLSASLFLCFFFHDVRSEDEGRYLVYNSGGVFKFIIGFGVPVHVPMSLIFAHNFQFQYNAVDNATEWQYLIQNGILRSLAFTRHQLYSQLHSFMTRNGGTADCILKFICQISETPIDSSGLVGEILQTIFTPDRNENTTFVAAWASGMAGAGCEEYECPHGQGFLDQISLTY